MANATIGSISEGTLRPQDLIPRFQEVLEEIDPVSESIQEYPIPSDALEDDEHSWWDSEDASDLLIEMEDRLDELAPPFCRFGSLDGDGACFGFWPVIERIEEGDDVARLTEGGPLGMWEYLEDEPVPKSKTWVDLAEYHLFVNGDEQYRYVAHINDHGNISLYKWLKPGEYQLVWDIV